MGCLPVPTTLRTAGSTTASWWIRRSRREPDVGSATDRLLGGHRHRPSAPASAMTAASSASFLAFEATAGTPQHQQFAVELLGFGDVLGSDEHRRRSLVHLHAMWSMIASILAASVMYHGSPGFVSRMLGVFGAIGDTQQKYRRRAAHPAASAGPGHSAPSGTVDQRLHGDGVEHLSPVSVVSILLGLDGGLQPVGPALQRRDAAAGRVDPGGPRRRGRCSASRCSSTCACSATFTSVSVVATCSSGTVRYHQVPLTFGGAGLGEWMLRRSASAA